MTRAYSDRRTSPWKPRYRLARCGAIVSLLDTAAAFAVHTVIGPDGRTVTVDLTVHFLRPASDGRIEAHARVLRRGGRVCILSVEARDGAAEIVATATMTYFIQT